MNSIPVTILSGFLGSGKTTFLNQMIKSNREKNIFVIMNEFGEINIDSELLVEIEDTQIYQLNNGCMCCVANNEMKSTFAKIMTLKDQGEVNIDHIVIELSGLANPEPVIRTITDTPFLCDCFYIDSVYALVDSQNGMNQLGKFEEMAPQILYADKILLTKEAQNQLKQLMDKIHQINPFIPVEAIEFEGDVAGRYLDKNLFGQKPVAFNDYLNKWISNYSDNSPNNDHHHHHSDLISFAFELEASFKADQVEKWLEALIKEYGADLVRYKGLMAVEEFDHQLIVQGVHQWFQLNRGNAWKTNEPRVTRMVFIGHNLEPIRIKQLLLSPDSN